MRSRDAADVRHRLGSLVGQVERVDSPVIGVVTPLEEPERFELVDQRHEPARNHAQQRRERLLTTTPAASTKHGAPKIVA